MMKPTERYLPEAALFAGKDGRTCRPFVEDCVVAEASDGFPILAERGVGTQIGVGLSDLTGIGEETLRAALALPRAENKNPLPCRGGSVLLFDDLLRSTGLIVALRLRDNPETVRRAILSPVAQPFYADLLPPPNAEEERLCRIAESIRATRKILSPERFPGVWTHCLRIADFAGCRVEYSSIPIENLPLDRTSQDTLTAFLLCTFLTLRRSNGAVGSVGEGVRDRFRIRVEQVRDVDVGALSSEGAKSILPFLRAPCFGSIGCRGDGRLLTIEAAFAFDPTIRASDPPKSLGWRIFIEEIR